VDFGNALLLVSTVFLVVEFVARLFPTITAREKVIAAIVAGQAATIVVANSDWGAKQVVDGLALDKMNGASLVIVGLAVAGLATIGKQALTAVTNIGENKKDL